MKLDHIKAKELSELANHQIKLAGDYAKERAISGNAKSDLEIILTSELKEIRKEKANVGIEMAYVMLMERNLEAVKLYKIWQTAEANYKGLEKLIEAHQSKISLEQSIMRYIGIGERNG